MEGNRNWAGIAALVLAGLALLVALDGRFGSMVAPANADVYPVAVQLRARDEAFRMEKFSIAPDGAPAPVIPDVKPIDPAIPPAVAAPNSDKVAPEGGFYYVQPPRIIIENQGGFDGSGKALFRDLAQRALDYVPQLLQLVGIIALVLIGVRLLNRRGSAPRGPAVE